MNPKLAHIKDLLMPEKRPHGRYLGKSNREMFNVILYWLNTVVPWQRVYSRYRSLTLAVVWESVLAGMIVQDLVDETTLMLDAPLSRGSGVKKGTITRKRSEVVEA